MTEMLGNVPAVFGFELRRSMKPVQMIWWAALAGFPVFIVSMVRMLPMNQQLPDMAWTFLLYVLVPMLIAMLGTFQWTTTTVSSELEEKSWVYLSVRPNGGTAVLVGKLLAAVVWVWSACAIGLSVATLLTTTEDKFGMWWPLMLAATLAVPVYASIYTCLGCLFPRRAMVLGIAYSLAFEIVMSLVPAMVSKFTIQFRIRSLAMNWLSPDRLNMPRRMQTQYDLLDPGSPWLHCGIIASATIVLLIVSVVAIRVREFSPSDEPEV